MPGAVTSKYDLVYAEGSLILLRRCELHRRESESILNHLVNCLKGRQRLNDSVASADDWQRLAKAISDGFDGT